MPSYLIMVTLHDLALRSAASTLKLYRYIIQAKIMKTFLKNQELRLTTVFCQVSQNKALL